MTALTRLLLSAMAKSARIHSEFREGRTEAEDDEITGRWEDHSRIVEKVQEAWEAAGCPDADGWGA